MDAASHSPTSVLSSGDWYKIAILRSGAYKIDYAFLSEMGLDMNNLDPKKLAIYGNSYNGMLPQANDAERPYDLNEISIIVPGEGDGSFDTGDYLLFYGKSSDHLSYDVDSDEFNFERNIYSDTAFYFLTTKNTDGLRMPSMTFPAGTEPITTTYQSIETHELEENSIISSGRHWFGERFTSA